MLQGLCLYHQLLKHVAIMNPSVKRGTLLGYTLLLFSDERHWNNTRKEYSRSIRTFSTHKALVVWEGFCVN